MNQNIIGSDNGLLAVWHQAIIWTNAGFLSIGTLWSNFSETIIKLEWAASNGNRYPPYPQVMATAISQ